MLFQDTLTELQKMKSSQASLELETSDNEKALELLKDRFTVTQQESRLIMPYRDKVQTAAINHQLVTEGISVYALHPQQNDLEQLFIDITSKN